MDLTLDDFARAVGVEDPVSVQGTGSQGGAVEGIRAVSAPAGISRIDAAEMVVECGAGTPVVELNAALSEAGQMVTMPVTGSVGGTLSIGRSDITRLGHGPMRDVLLQTRFVTASGKVTKAGGPTVKNVSGFDLCRLLIGAYGTLGFLGDVILRTRPQPRFTAWFTSDRDPFELLGVLYRPVALLWDGASTWVRLDGDATDVAATALELDLTEVHGPPHMPREHRWSLPPSQLTLLRSHIPGTFVAEIGVGVVHHTEPPPDRKVDDTVRALHARIKAQFDPTGRLNPGVDPLVVH